MYKSTHDVKEELQPFNAFFKKIVHFKQMLYL